MSPGPRCGSNPPTPVVDDTVGPIFQDRAYKPGTASETRRMGVVQMHLRGSPFPGRGPAVVDVPITKWVYSGLLGSEDAERIGSDRSDGVSFSNGQRERGIAAGAAGNALESGGEQAMPWRGIGSSHARSRSTGAERHRSAAFRTSHACRLEPPAGLVRAVASLHDLHRPWRRNARSPGCRLRRGGRSLRTSARRWGRRRVRQLHAAPWMRGRCIGSALRIAPRP